MLSFIATHEITFTPANGDARTYEERGDSAAADDIRAGNTADGIDDGMVLQHLGLDDGGAEDRMLREKHGDDGPAVVVLARDAVLRGYHARVAAARAEALAVALRDDSTPAADTTGDAFTWIDTLARLNPHPGGPIRRHGWPTDASFDVWLSRADGQAIAELVDLLDARGFIDANAILTASAFDAIDTLREGRAGRVVRTWIDRHTNGVTNNRLASVIDQLGRVAGGMFRAGARDEILDAWVAFVASTTAYLTSDTTTPGVVTLAWCLGKSTLTGAWGPVYEGTLYRVTEREFPGRERVTYWTTLDAALAHLRGYLTSENGGCASGLFEASPNGVDISVVSAVTRHVAIADEVATGAFGITARLLSRGRPVVFDRVKGDPHGEATYARMIAAIEAATIPSELTAAAEALLVALRAGLVEAPT